MRRRAWTMVAATVALGSTALAVPAAAGPTGGALPPPLTLVVPVAGVSGIPLDAVGVAMNVTVTNPAGPGFLTVYPCGEVPVVSNLNYALDQTVPNLVIAALDADGDVCIDTMTTTDVVIDVAGYLPKGSSITPLAQPVRFLDTRDGTGAPKRRVIGGEVLSVQVAGRFGVPGDASGAVANVTAVNPDGAGFVTVFPCGQAIPETSTLNYTAGTVVPNLVVTGLGAGSVCLYSPITTDLLVDVAAYLPAGAAGVKTLAKPVRVIDTRTNLGVAGGVIGAGTATLAVAGIDPVPASATAAIVNITAIGAGVPGFVTAWPAGEPRPSTSNANFLGDQVVANASIVPLGGGAMSFRANTAVDLVVDITGYIEGVTAFVPMSPVRLYDSREEAEPTCHLGVLWDAAASTYRVIDTRTGVTAYPTSFAGFGYIRDAFIDTNDCHVYIAGVGSGAEMSIVEFDRAGATVASSRIRGPVASGSLMGAPGGPIAIIGDANTPQSVTDPFDGSVFFSLPDLGRDSSGGARLWRPVGVSADGSIIALFTYGAGEGYTVVYFGPSGVRRGQTHFDSFRPIAMSPDGTYLVGIVSTGIASAELWITTLDGVKVSSTPFAWGFGAVETRIGFASPGRVFGCGRAGDERWDLFTQPTAGSAGRGCLVASG